MHRTRYIAGLALSASLLMTGTAFAQTTTTSTDNEGAGRGWGRGGMHMAGDHRPGIFGSVTAVNGSTITVVSKGFGRNAEQTTYTVDAMNATVMKDGATSSLANIAVGDTVMIAGSVSGTNVTATAIRDGIPMRGGKGGYGMTPMNGALPQGDGNPVVGGTVTGVTGTTIAITNRSNVSYSIDAANAKIVKQGATSTVGAIATGDNVMVQGTVNGNAIIATSVIDSPARPASSATSSDTGRPQPAPRGFMGMIGGFFHRLFGFF